jgi:hypothetical protein
MENVHILLVIIIDNRLRLRLSPHMNTYQVFAENMPVHQQADNWYQV